MVSLNSICRWCRCCRRCRCRARLRQMIMRTVLIVFPWSYSLRIRWRFQHGFPSFGRLRAACFWQHPTFHGTVGVTGPFFLFQHRCQGGCDAGNLFISETCQSRLLQRSLEERSTLTRLRRRCLLGDPPRLAIAGVTGIAGTDVSVTLCFGCCDVETALATALFQLATSLSRTDSIKRTAAIDR